MNFIQLSAEIRPGFITSIYVDFDKALYLLNGDFDQKSQLHFMAIMFPTGDIVKTRETLESFKIILKKQLQGMKEEKCDQERCS